MGTRNWGREHTVLRASRRVSDSVAAHCFLAQHLALPPARQMSHPNFDAVGWLDDKLLS